MLTIDLAQCGSALNMPAFFSICVRQLFSSPDNTTRIRVNEIRKHVKQAIEHVSHEQLNRIMNEVKSRTRRYRVITRHDLEARLNRAGVFGVLTTAALLEDAGTLDAMLFLLHSKPHPYKGEELLNRFFFFTQQR